MSEWVGDRRQSRDRRRCIGCVGARRNHFDPLYPFPVFFSCITTVVAGGRGQPLSFFSAPPGGPFCKLPKSRPFLRPADVIFKFRTLLRYPPPPNTRNFSSHTIATPPASHTPPTSQQVRTPGSLPPLRFVTYGVQSGVRFYSIDRRSNKLQLSYSKASFNCAELTQTNSAISHKFIASCCVLADGIHSLMGTQGSGEIFYFEDAQALRWGGRRGFERGN